MEMTTSAHGGTIDRAADVAEFSACTLEGSSKFINKASFLREVKEEEAEF
jgi:hypothetical protein